nr:ribonuclease E/G [Ectobacillus ponti]
MNLRGTEKRIVVQEEGRVAEILYDRPGQGSLVGHLYAGRVAKVLPGMQAAFVDIGAEQHAYLHKDDLPAAGGRLIQQLVHEGQRLLVQVTKDAVDTKGPKLTGKVELTGRYAVYMPYEGTTAVSKKIRDEAKREELLSLGGQGVIFRSACAGVPLSVVEDELMRLRSLFEQLQQRLEQEKPPVPLHAAQSLLDRLFQEIPVETVAAVITDDRASVQDLKAYAEEVTLYSGKEDILLHHGLASEIEKALKKVVWLDNGAYLLIEQTETLTVIDVNTGKFTGKQTQQATVRKTNELAAAEIARQLRLRDIGGMILIDFINMREREDQQAVRRALIEGLRRDAATVRVLDFTGLGILEMTRRRKRKSLRDLLLAPAGPYGGYKPSPEAAAYELERDLLQYRGSDYEAVLVEAPAEVRQAFAVLGLQTGVPLQVHFQESPVSSYTIRHLGTHAEMLERKKQ